MIQRRDIKRDYLLSGKKRLDWNQSEGINLCKERKTSGWLSSHREDKTRRLTEQNVVAPSRAQGIWSPVISLFVAMDPACSESPSHYMYDSYEFSS